MAIAQATPQVHHPHVPPAELDPLWRMTVSQYHAIIEAGILDADSRVELLEGVLVEKMSKNPSHRKSTRSTRKALEALLGDGWYVESQEPITLFSSEPEPDVMVARLDRSEYPDRHPGPTETLIVVEVADSTIARDRGVKLRMYARAGIPEYWIIDLNMNRVEVRTQPAGDDYANLVIYSAGDSIPVALDGALLGQIPVSSLLPA